ncbi:MAG: hypothetical protein QME81_18575, partial [bacterium]|nr:hypothetical protein [bacterium]
MKKLLFVTYGFPPLLNPRAIQVVRMAKYLLNFGWRTTILTVDEKSAFEISDSDLFSLIPEGIRVERVRTFEPKNLIRILYRSLPLILALPDSKIGWAYFATRKGKDILKKGGYDLILSSAQPFSSHLVGLKLKKETGLPWVAHFSDPWVDSPYFPDYNITPQHLRCPRECYD